MISNILAEILRGLLDDIIQLNQSAFILGRKIADNILLAHELMRRHHKDKYGCCALKVYLQKAYDSLSWDFLEEVLLAFRFPAHFINLVMASIKSCMFSIMINGQLKGFFPGKRGLRQEDPISPLLFVLCIEYLSKSLQKRTKEGFSYHKDCTEMKLTHLCFANDLFIFSNGYRRSIEIIKNDILHF